MARVSADFTIYSLYLALFYKTFSVLTTFLKFLGVLVFSPPFSVLAICSPISLICFVSCIKVGTLFIGTYNGEYYTQCIV